MHLATAGRASSVVQSVGPPRENIPKQASETVQGGREPGGLWVMVREIVVVVVVVGEWERQ